jgi:pimeloyl-ACP methyl ester carboxylesterase
MSARATPTSHSYYSQGLRLHYLDWGNPEAPPLLLVHGNRDHCHNWDWVAQRLRDHFHIIAPDFRGHGDSSHVLGGGYSHSGYLYDLAQLIHQQNLSPLSVIAHSLGGSVALRYAGVYPEHIKKMVVIEGTGGPHWLYHSVPVHERLRNWIDGNRKAAGRTPRRYPSLEAAFERMQTENKHLREDQARYLTVHGSNQNEDGTYSWKFDNYTHVMAPFDLNLEQTRELWGRIAAPLLLVSGSESEFVKHRTEDPAKYFQNARSIEFGDAGHWVHHDQLDGFVDAALSFLLNED